MLAYRHADIWAGFSQYFSYTGDEVVSKTRYLCASITTTRRKYRRRSRKRKRSKRRRRRSRRNRRRRRKKTRRRITRKRKKDVVEYYIQLYSPECTLAENININNNKQNKDRNILGR